MKALEEMNAKPLVVLDACTILNLLRIDDDDSDFLLNLVAKWQPCLPEMVLSEAREHVDSNFYSEEKNDHIRGAINRVVNGWKMMDKEIKKDLDTEYGKIKEFCSYSKRENGELLCVALSLLKSRYEEKRVTFFTDDYKATETFQDFYRFHQIGTIGDTVDLLTLLYWLTPEERFQYSLYRSFIMDLKAEYNQHLANTVARIETHLERKKRDKCKDGALLENLNNISLGYHRSDLEKMERGFRFFQENSNYREVKRIVGDIDIKSYSLQFKRASEHLDRMKRFPIYRVS